MKTEAVDVAVTAKGLGSTLTGSGLAIEARGQALETLAWERHENHE